MPSPTECLLCRTRLPQVQAGIEDVYHIECVRCRRFTVTSEFPGEAAFAARWDRRFPTISRSWREKWQLLTPFFVYPPEIRKVIYTTNAIESIQYSLRKVVRKRDAFPTQESVRKVLYVAMQRISKRWCRPIKDWAAALNHFAIRFEGRIVA